MQVRIDELRGHLAGSLAPVYVLSGDEPQQMIEAADAIRAAARQRGFDEREVLMVDQSFDWDRLHAATETLSLFGSRRLMELRLPSGKPGVQGARALKNWAERPPADTLLLLQCGRIERRDAQAAWYKALDSVGVMVTIWPLDLPGTQAWIERRMRALGLKPGAEAVQLLADRVEGNLLAAAQEIEKLLLFAGPGPVDVAAVLEAVSDSARFSIFDLVDACLVGDAGRAVRILSGLREEGVDDVLVLWGLAREIRSLHDLAERRASGMPLQKLLESVRPARRQAIVRQALDRLDAHALGLLLAQCARVDRTIKGREQSTPREELLALSLGLAGVRTIAAMRDDVLA